MEISAAEKAIRAARFADSSVPEVSKKQAHRDFDRSKMFISNTEERLRSLLQRKFAAGEAISEAQISAAAAHGIDVVKLREESHAAPVSAPALYVEAGLVKPRPKRKVSRSKKAAADLPAASGLAPTSAPELRKSRRLSLSALRLENASAAPKVHDAAPHVSTASSTGQPSVLALTALAKDEPAGGPRATSTPKQARAALARIARLEASQAAGVALTAGQRERIATRHLWEEIVRREEAVAATSQ